jgi:hypothetical protein
MVAGLEEAEQERGGGPHAGGARHRGLCALQRRDQVLEHRVVAGPVAAVDEARLLALPDRLHRVHVLEHVHIGLVDGRGQGPARGRYVSPSPSRPACRSSRQCSSTRLRGLDQRHRGQRGRRGRLRLALGVADGVGQDAGCPRRSG